MREGRDSRAQRALARGSELATNGVIVVELQRMHQRLERQALDHERAEHDGEHDQRDRIAIREFDW